VTSGETIHSTYGHNHMADPGAVVAKQAQNAVLQKAFANPKLKTANLVEEFVDKTADPSFRTRTVTVKTLQRMVQMRKAKALMKPAAPRSFDDLEILPDEFTVRIIVRIRGIIYVIYVANISQKNC
jgi:hypothetical protein